MSPADVPPPATPEERSGRSTWSQTLRDATLLLGGRALALAGAFACVKVMAGHLAPAEYGVVGLVGGVVALAYTLFQQPLGHAHGRYYLPHLETARGAVLGAAYRRLLVVGSACGGLVCAAWAAWEVAEARLEPDVAAAFAAIAALSLPVMALWGRGMVALNLRRRQARQASSDAARAWLRALSVVLVSRAWPPSALSFLFVLLLVDVLCLGMVPWRWLGTSFVHRQPLERAAVRATTRTLLRFGAPFMLWGVVGWLQATSDRWIVDRALSRDDLGLYFLAFQVATLVPGAVAGVLVSLVTPRLYGSFADEAQRTRIAVRVLLRACAWLGLAGAAACGGALLGGEALLVWIGGGRYAGTGTVLVVLVASQTVFHLAYVASTLVLVEEVPRRLLIPKFVGGVVAASAMIVGSQVAGVLGVAVGGAVGSIAYACSVAVVVRTLARRHGGLGAAPPSGRDLEAQASWD